MENVLRRLYPARGPTLAMLAGDAASAGKLSARNEWTRPKLHGPILPPERCRISGRMLDTTNRFR
jgi:hypothetical protein